MVLEEASETFGSASLSAVGDTDGLVGGGGFGGFSGGNDGNGCSGEVRGICGGSRGGGGGFLGKVVAYPCCCDDGSGRSQQPTRGASRAGHDLIPWVDEN